MFNGDKLYILSKKLGVEKGPIHVSKMFKGVDKVDAAFKRQMDGSTILLSGKRLVFGRYEIYFLGFTS